MFENWINFYISDVTSSTFYLNWDSILLYRHQLLDNILVFKYELLLLLSVICYILVNSKKSEKIKVLYQPTPSNQRIMNRLNKAVSGFSPLIIFQSPIFQIITAAKLSPNLRIHYHNEIFELEDGGSLKLELYPKDFYEMKENTPIVFLLLGVCGSTKEKYPRIASKRAFEKGCRTVIINKRGFARTPLTSAKFYNKDEVEDIGKVISHFHKKYPSAHKYMIGTSQGASYTIRYLIQYNKETPIRAAVSISNPFNNKKNAEMIQQTYWGRKAIGVITQQTKRILEFHKDNHHFLNLLRKTVGHTDLYSIINKCVNFHELTENLIYKLGGYESADDFYDAFNLNKHLHNVNTPVLFINNKEDPFISYHSLPFEQIYANENFIAFFTNKGGHIEYYSGLSFEWWAYKTALEYIEIFQAND